MERGRQKNSAQLMDHRRPCNVGMTSFADTDLTKASFFKTLKGANLLILNVKLLYDMVRHKKHVSCKQTFKEVFASTPTYILLRRFVKYYHILCSQHDSTLTGSSSGIFATLYILMGNTLEQVI
jgi:hypothetical protein